MYLLAVVLDSEILATAEMTNAGVWRIHSLSSQTTPLQAQ